MTHQIHRICICKVVLGFLDLPSIASGEGIGFLDPHEMFFKVEVPNEKTLAKTSSYQWNLRSDRENIAARQHQFDPFKQDLFGFTEETFKTGYFPGTIFRFPFRNDKMRSDLSKTVYDQTKIKSLVNSLEADSHNILLFLKNLESIEFYERTSGQMTKLLDIRIPQSCLTIVKQQRNKFQNKVNAQFEKWVEKDSISVIYPISIEVTKQGVSGSAAMQNDNKSVTWWFISQYFAGQKDVGSISLPPNAKHLPVVGVALPFSFDPNRSILETEPKGHIFCFLPLPLEQKSPTGLHFHVHGCFAIDQNRRHLKWPSADLGKLTDEALIWNIFLVNNVLPNAMFHLTSYLISNFSDGMNNFTKELTEKLECCKKKNPEYLSCLIYSLLPDKKIVTSQWQQMVENVYKQIWQQKICFSLVRDGKWLPYTSCIFDDMENSSTTNHLVRSILFADKQNLSSLPIHLFKRLPDNSKKMTVEMVCESLKKVQNDIDLSDEQKMCLLTYLLDGLKSPTALIGLKLLPLADGEWVEFKVSSSVEKIYVDSKDHPRKLLPGLEHHFLRVDDVPKKCVELASNGK